MTAEAFDRILAACLPGIAPADLAYAAGLCLRYASGESSVGALESEAVARRYPDRSGDDHTPVPSTLPARRAR